MEEQAILDATAEEVRQKQLLVEEKMKRLVEDTEALAHEIERLQMEMKEDDVSFLMVRSSSFGSRDRDQMFRNQRGAQYQQPWPTQSSWSFWILGWGSLQTRGSAVSRG